MTVGFVLMLIGAFIVVIGAKGTYKYLPPFYQAPQSEKSNPISESITAAIASFPAGSIQVK